MHARDEDKATEYKGGRSQRDEGDIWASFSPRSICGGWDELNPVGDLTSVPHIASITFCFPCCSELDRTGGISVSGMIRSIHLLLSVRWSDRVEDDLDP